MSQLVQISNAFHTAGAGKALTAAYVNGDTIQPLRPASYMRVIATLAWGVAPTAAYLRALWTVDGGTTWVPVSTVNAVSLGVVSMDDGEFSLPVDAVGTHEVCVSVPPGADLMVQAKMTNAGASDPTLLATAVLEDAWGGAGAAGTSGGAGGVAGAEPDHAIATANPVVVGGTADAALSAVHDGDVARLVTDLYRRLRTLPEGEAADDAASTALNPVKVGGVADAALSLVTDADMVHLVTDLYRRLRVNAEGGAAQDAALVGNPIPVAVQYRSTALDLTALDVATPTADQHGTLKARTEWYDGIDEDIIDDAGTPGDPRALTTSFADTVSDWVTCDQIQRIRYVVVTSGTAPTSLEFDPQWSPDDGTTVIQHSCINFVSGGIVTMTGMVIQLVGMEGAATVANGKYELPPVERPPGALLMRVRARRTGGDANSAIIVDAYLEA